QSNFSTWLNAFTYKFCINHLNKTRENKNGQKLDSCNDDQPHLLIDVSDNSLFHMREEKLQKAMQYLSPEDKSILLLKYQDELAINEIMALLNLDENAFNMRLRKAKASIIEIYNRL
ncbi:MAG: RNA polymerase subunit sigma-70, partial [Bacteroidia bacterium]|nr:RNA polymerase subunit sigma-70 [Bacteroidia bacterium]